MERWLSILSLNPPLVKLIHNSIRMYWISIIPDVTTWSVDDVQSLTTNRIQPTRPQYHNYSRSQNRNLLQRRCEKITTMKLFTGVGKVIGLHTAMHARPRGCTWTVSKAYAAAVVASLAINARRKWPLLPFTRFTAPTAIPTHHTLHTHNVYRNLYNVTAVVNQWRRAGEIPTASDRCTYNYCTIRAV